MRSCGLLTPPERVCYRGSEGQTPRSVHFCWQTESLQPTDPASLSLFSFRASQLEQFPLFRHNAVDREWNNLPPRSTVTPRTERNKMDENGTVEQRSPSYKSYLEKIVRCSTRETFPEPLRPQRQLSSGLLDSGLRRNRPCRLPPALSRMKWSSPASSPASGDL